MGRCKWDAARRTARTCNHHSLRRGCPGSAQRMRPRGDFRPCAVHCPAIHTTAPPNPPPVSRCAMPHWGTPLVFPHGLFARCEGQDPRDRGELERARGRMPGLKEQVVLFILRVGVQVVPLADALLLPHPEAPHRPTPRSGLESSHAPPTHGFCNQRGPRAAITGDNTCATVYQM